MHFEGHKSDEQIDIDLFYEKASGELDKARIRESDFVEPYGQETVERDLRTVETGEVSHERDRKEKPETREPKKIADIFEAIVLEHGELSEWFGNNAFTIKTSKYDDYENGVDAVVEFRGDEPKSASFLGMAVDVTFGLDNTKKLNRIKSHIDKGRLGTVKYFHSEHMGIHGQLSKLPEVVLGVDKRTVMELAELWKGHKNKALGGHKVQIMMLMQMREQLDTFAKYADSINNLELVRIFSERLGLVEGILREKTEIFEKVKTQLADDSVHSGMIAYLRRWKEKMAKEKKVQ